MRSSILSARISKAVFIAFFCVSSWGFLIRDDVGRLVHFDVPPKRVVSLAPSITKTAFLLGAGDRLVGVTTFCTQPPEARLLPKVGTVVDFNIEEILRLKADLVIGTTLASRGLLKKVESLGVKVLIFRAPKNFRELCEQFMKLARVFGKEERGLEILSKVEKRLKEVREGIPKGRRPRVFVQVGANPLWAAGKESFLGEAIEMAGGEDIIRGQGGPIDRELVIKMNPDVILVVDMGIVGEREVNRWRQFDNLKAVREGKIFVIESDLYCSPTPVSFVEGVRILVDLLHGRGRSSMINDELQHLRKTSGSR